MVAPPMAYGQMDIASENDEIGMECQADARTNDSGSSKGAHGLLGPRDDGIDVVYSEDDVAPVNNEDAAQNEVLDEQNYPSWPKMNKIHQAPETRTQDTNTA